MEARLDPNDFSRLCVIAPGQRVKRTRLSHGAALLGGCYQTL